MNLSIIDNVINDIEDYVNNILKEPFYDIVVGEDTFKNIQIRNNNDECAKFVLNVLDNKYEINTNFIRKSPYLQEEPNFIHTDEMMGDITVILYLSKNAPKEDGTTIYDQDHKKTSVIYSKQNRMLIFDSFLPHSRNIYDNFGENNDSRLIQVLFLKRI